MCTPNIYTYIMYTYVCMYVNTYISIYTYILYMCIICIYIYIHTYTYMCVCICICTPELVVQVHAVAKRHAIWILLCVLILQHTPMHASSLLHACSSYLSLSSKFMLSPNDMRLKDPSSSSTSLSSSPPSRLQGKKKEKKKGRKKERNPSSST